MSESLPPPAGTRDHYEQHPAPWLAGVSHRGIRHRTNEDALSLAARIDPAGHKSAIMAVSDGVSSSAASDVASLLAVETACKALIGVLESTPSPDPPGLDQALAAAFDRANSAIIAGLPATGYDSGSCTLILAVVSGDTISVASVGDSRAYWFGDDDRAVALSLDDSMAQAQIEMGVPREQAETGFQAHAITKWLGPNSIDWTPRVIRHRPTGPGWLMVCSDGLWNYASEPVQLQAVVRSGLARAGADPAALTGWLVQWANDQGGRDNITVALARLD